MDPDALPDAEPDADPLGEYEADPEADSLGLSDSLPIVGGASSAAQVTSAWSPSAVNQYERFSQSVMLANSSGVSACENAVSVSVNGTSHEVMSVSPS